MRRMLPQTVGLSVASEGLFEAVHGKLDDASPYLPYTWLSMSYTWAGYRSFKRPPGVRPLLKKLGVTPELIEAEETE